MSTLAEVNTGSGDLRPYEKVFDASHWENTDEFTSRESVQHDLYNWQLKPAKKTFHDTALGAIVNGNEGQILQPGQSLWVYASGPGTVVLYEKEQLRNDTTLSESIEKDRKKSQLFDLSRRIDYPAQVSNLINCLPVNLIQMKGGPDKEHKDYNRGLVVLTKGFEQPGGEVEHWEYAREAWFAICLPTKQGPAFFTFTDCKVDPGSAGSVCRSDAHEANLQSVVGQSARFDIFDRFTRRELILFERTSSIEVFPDSGQHFVKDLESRRRLIPAPIRQLFNN